MIKYLLGLIGLSLLSWGFIHDNFSDSPALESKINGASLVSPPTKISASNFQALHDLNANWVAIIPYAFSRGGSPQITFNHQRQWWGERTEGSCELVGCARKYDLKILMKPHVWVTGEGWPGEYDLESEADWGEWEVTYRNYILTFARIADSLDVEMFAVGTEFRIPAVEREQYWRKLIGEVRSIYHGKVTYAANWDNYQKVKFWDLLDYIGIDAYFPISNETNPTMDQLEAGWEEEARRLQDFSTKYDRPILFTEFGYQSLNKAAGNHWEIDKSHNSINMEVQANAYRAVFNTFWRKEWFAGGFFWKWHLREDVGGIGNPDFTPQGKPAEEVIREHFKKFNQ